MALLETPIQCCSCGKTLQADSEGIFIHGDIRTLSWLGLIGGTNFPSVAAQGSGDGMIKRSDIPDATKKQAFCWDCFDKATYRVKEVVHPVPMTLDDAIAHATQKSMGSSPCAEAHKQLAEWLTELRELRSPKRKAAMTVEEIKALTEEMAKVNTAIEEDKLEILDGISDRVSEMKDEMEGLQEDLDILLHLLDFSEYEWSFERTKAQWTKPADFLRSRLNRLVPAGENIEARGEEVEEALESFREQAKEFQESVPDFFQRLKDATNPKEKS